MDHGQLRHIVQQRLRDAVLLQLIGKWMNAGVLQDGGIESASSRRGG
jgi:hypothetical protein